MDVMIPTVALPKENGDGQPKGNGTHPEPANPQEAFQLMDRRDEAQIVESLKGRYLEEFVYEFCWRHDEPGCGCPDLVVGLSWVGILEAAREYGGIKVPLDRLRKDETEERVEIAVEAVDTKTSSSRIGVAVQPKMMRVRGGVQEDPFVYQKAMAKAQRNALRALLPLTLIKAWLEAHRKKASPLPPAEKNGRAAPPPALPANGNGVPKNGNGVWHPSDGQVRRIFGLARGRHLGRDRVLECLKSACGVDKPEEIKSYRDYEALCDLIQAGASGKA